MMQTAVAGGGASPGAKPDMRVLLTGRAAQLFGIGTQTLRDWERAGIVPRGRRSIFGWRYWTRAEFLTLAVVVAERIAKLPGCQRDRAELIEEFLGRWDSYAQKRLTQQRES